MARPVKYSTEQILLALEETKGAVYLAAKALGCCADVIYDRAKKVKTVARLIQTERGKVLDTAELKLYTAVLAGEPWAVILVLRTLGKDRGYSERRQVTGTPDAEPIREIHEVVVRDRMELTGCARRLVFSCRKP
jgi:hypothetical protein